ncbi:SDR family oxidoreductase [Rhodococcus sp. PAMC28707]|nr:SDR family oxidoreductase [Rhodococcus sp. PAMC28705]QCB60938.1 SDR family oxidoreductase [Rhodococcus sp. PAMC28707]
MTRTALVTGASRGLGAAIARTLAPDHHVYLGGRSSGSLAAVSSELEGSTPWPVDLTDHDAVAAAVQPMESLDVLVHNAGVAALGTIEESSVVDWRRQYESNVLSVVSLTQLLLPALRRAGGHVVLINSGAGIRANPGWGGYAASKFALRAFADALRQEEPALRVTSVHPGRIDTDMQRAIVEHEGGDYDGSKFLQAGSVALAVRNAIDTPADTHPTEIVLRSR